MPNPIFSDKAVGEVAVLEGVPMSVQGAVNKTFLCGLLLSLGAGAVYYQYLLGYADKVSALMTGGLIIGFILAMIIIFSRKAMHILVPLYAFAEGVALGGISAFFNAQFPGIVVQAVTLTFLALFSLLGLYQARVIRATDKFRSTIFISTAAIAVFYVISFVLGLFGIQMPVLYDTSLIGIAFSVLVCAIAALNLIIDFDFIERGAQSLLPKQYEWYGAFGLMVTLVWLYLEVLRLLAKLRKD